MFQNFWCCRLWINKSFSFEKTRLLTTSEICPLDTFCVRLKYGIFGVHIHDIWLNISTYAHMVSVVGLMNDEGAIRSNGTVFCYYQRDQIQRQWWMETALIHKNVCKTHKSNTSQSLTDHRRQEMAIKCKCKCKYIDVFFQFYYLLYAIVHYSIDLVEIY